MSPYHVLVTDDDDAIWSLLARILVRTYPAMTVWAVKDGREALDIYDHNPLDLLIINYDMPRLDGLALLATLRQSRHTTLPIVMVSANMTIERQARPGRDRLSNQTVLHTATHGNPHNPASTIADIFSCVTVSHNEYDQMLPLDWRYNVLHWSDRSYPAGTPTRQLPVCDMGTQQ